MGREMKKFEYRVPYDIPIYWETKPTRKDIDNIKKVMVGIVNQIKISSNINEKDIIKDTECNIEVVPSVCKEGYVIKTLTEFSFWCYEKVGGKIITRKIKENIK